MFARIKKNVIVVLFRKQVIKKKKLKMILVRVFFVKVNEKIIVNSILNNFKRASLIMIIGGLENIIKPLNILKL